MSDIMRKIAALMAKANGTENEHEAAAFAAKAHALLAEHNLALEDVMRYGAAKAGERVQQTPHANKYVGGWRTDLMHGVAKYYFCDLLISSSVVAGKRSKSFLLIGKAHNVAVAQSMFDYLEKTTVRLGREWMKGHAGSRAEQLDFERGCGSRIAARLRELRKQAEAAAPVSGSTALVVLYDQEAQAIKEFIANQIGEVRQTKGKSYSLRGRGAVAGREAGNAVGLNTQVGNTKQTALT